MNMTLLPNFLFIGPGKTATTWIYQVLKEHPDIGMPDFKDSQFFDRYWERGLRWYVSLFRDVRGKAIGEVSTCYFTNKLAPARIEEHLPHAKLLCCLRDPVERSISDYYYRKGVGAINCSLEEALETTDIIQCGRYAQCLDKYSDFLQRGSLKVLFYDHLIDNPHVFISDIFEFLGVATDFIPTIVEEKIRPEGEGRNEHLSKLVYQFSQLFKNRGFHKLVMWIKNNALINSLLFTETVYDVPQEWVEIIYPHFRYDIERLIHEFNFETPKHWLRDLKTNRDRNAGTST